MSDPRIEAAIELMNNFAQRTGLDSDRPQQRYLWTDAFAVCNFLSLARKTGEQSYTELALRLVDQVHHTLGRNRADNPHSGWISRLNEREGESHPTRGGLRIGKHLPERGVDQPFDEHLEWDRDGQYFHYLTKWMHALDQVSRSTGDPRYNAWARELAASAQKAFTYMPSTGNIPRMYWKMSIDLTRPLVYSMGQHDPLDGYITSIQLRATAAKQQQTADGTDLIDASRQFATMVEGTELATPDPLGIGGLLIDSYRLAQLMRQGAIPNDGLLERLLSAALTGLNYYARSSELQAPAEYRLAFRELGLAIGLYAVQRTWEAVTQYSTATSHRLRTQLEPLLRYVRIGEQIEAFWLDNAHQSADIWSKHRDINEVMLTTQLVPDGFLTLAFSSSAGSQASAWE